MVLTGGAASLDAIGRLVYAVRGAIDDVAVFDFRGAVPDSRREHRLPARRPPAQGA